MKESHHGITPGQVNVIHICTKDFAIEVCDQTANSVEVVAYEYEDGELSPVKIVVTPKGQGAAGAPHRVRSVSDEYHWDVWSMTAPNHEVVTKATHEPPGSTVGLTDTVESDFEDDNEEFFDIGQDDEIE